MRYLTVACLLAPAVLVGCADVHKLGSIPYADEQKDPARSVLAPYPDDPSAAHVYFNGFPFQEAISSPEAKEQSPTQKLNKSACLDNYKQAFSECESAFTRIDPSHYNTNMWKCLVNRGFDHGSSICENSSDK